MNCSNKKIDLDLTCKKQSVDFGNVSMLLNWHTKEAFDIYGNYLGQFEMKGEKIGIVKTEQK